jgi:HAD superfamily 5'-nucleotidase-like hydrolase
MITAPLAPNLVDGTPPERRVYCNRTLNLRTLRAVGFDMDYTLIHYRVDEWERRAYEHLRERLAARGWPVADLAFDPGLFVRGLIVDRELGNIVKANRFGYVKRAFHGTAPLEFDAQRKAYGRLVVDVNQARWVSLDTLFSHSEACMYAQLVDRLDAGSIPGTLGYGDLYDRVRGSLDRAHLEGHLKAEITADPERFVVLDPDLPLALMDLRASGKKLLLITNSDWTYTRTMMAWAFDRYLGGGSWRDLFHVVIVSAQKPTFFSGRQTLYQVVSDDGLLKPWVDDLAPGHVFSGGDAGKVEAHLRASGEEILYVGDHIFADVHASKRVLRWRTALVLRELEDEIRTIHAFQPSEARLKGLMEDKERLEATLAALRLAQQRQRVGYGPTEPEPGQGANPTTDDQKREADRLKAALAVLDAEITPLARASADLGNPHWGPLLRAGNDKSFLARQVERSADVYTSRVSNFLFISPFAYLRSPRGSLPHDPEVAGITADPDRGGEA